VVEHFREHIAGQSLADVRAALQENLRAVRKRVLDEHNAFVVVAEAVGQARERVKGWTDVPNSWSSIGAGLKKTCQKARAAFRDAAADASAVKLHEWRKRVKYLRYQFEIPRPLWPGRLEELAGEADRMGELLGDDHDLVVMRQELTRDPPPVAGDGERELLLALIDRRRAELEQDGLVLGERFFQDKPRELTRQLKWYWKAWRREACPTQANDRVGQV